MPATEGQRTLEPMPASEGPSARRALAGWRMPGLCAVCRRWDAGRVCASCLARFAPPQARCARCALPIEGAGATVCGACLAAPPDFDSARSRVDYGYPWDRLIAAFKFHAALDLAPALADTIVAATEAGPALERPDLIVPVPLAPQRLRERGFNQPWQLARRVARRLGCAADAGLVLRLRETAHQLDLPPEQRAGNVRGAFAVEPRRRAELRGRSIAVVDDVMTTGSTANEIARALKQAGASRVAVWTVARTPRPGQG